MDYRTEHDLLGEKRIPSDTYWGIHTERARENFTISRYQLLPVFIRAYALVKKAAVAANHELGYLPDGHARALDEACDDIIHGKISFDVFPLDALQGGAGTSTNMNLNEVIANRALEIIGKPKGMYEVIHPLEHVNLHQSTNDTFPTALRVACIQQLRILSDTTARLQGVFQQKEKAFAAIVTISRTELQEAVPVTLGSMFAAWAEAVGRDRWRTFKCEERLRVVNLGGTAVGTGLCAPRNYIFLVIEKLREMTGYGLSRGENMMGETTNADAFVEVSGILKAQATTLIKIATDLRLLALEKKIVLPAVQAGSSIMPGKVNPVMLEAVIQGGMKVCSNDLLLADAVSRGTLQINEFLPLIAHSILESLELLINATVLFAAQVENVAADCAVCEKRFNESETLITAFVPHIGYERATQLVREFHAEKHENMRAFLEEKLGKALVEKTLSPHALMALGYRENISREE